MVSEARQMGVECRASLTPDLNLEDNTEHGQEPLGDRRCLASPRGKWHFHKLEVCGDPAQSESAGTILPTASG